MKRLLCAMLAVLVLMGCAAAPVETTLAPTTVPEETSGPVLKSGYYVPVDEMFAESMIYIQLLLKRLLRRIKIMKRALISVSDKTNIVEYLD